MLGETGTEQFTIETRQNGKLIRSQPIHDPFLHNKTTIAISHWDLFKALFRRQFVITIEVSVHGTEGIQRTIMMLDPKAIEEETRSILEQRRASREESVHNAYLSAAPAASKPEADATWDEARDGRRVKHE